MIRIQVTRVEDNGAETDLGEVRMAELGAVASYRETADGAGVMRDVRSALACLSRGAAPEVRRLVAAIRAAMNETGRWVS